jgi:hypothetical protein
VETRTMPVACGEFAVGPVHPPVTEPEPSSEVLISEPLIVALLPGRRLARQRLLSERRSPAIHQSSCQGSQPHPDCSCARGLSKGRVCVARY